MDSPPWGLGIEPLPAISYARYSFVNVDGDGPAAVTHDFQWPPMASLAIAKAFSRVSASVTTSGRSGTETVKPPSACGVRMTSYSRWSFIVQALPASQMGAVASPAAVAAASSGRSPDDDKFGVVDAVRSRQVYGVVTTECVLLGQVSRLLGQHIVNVFVAPRAGWLDSSHCLR